MDKYLQRFTEYICVSDSKEDKEVFRYGLEAIVSSMECLGLSFLICCLLDEMYFGFFFILLLTLLKIQLTGYHCKTRGACCLSYLFMILTNLWCYRQLSFYSFWILLIEILVILYVRRDEVSKRLLGILLFEIICCLSNSIIVFQVMTTQLGLIIVKDIQNKRKEGTL